MWARLLLVFSIAAAVWGQQEPKDLLAEMSRRVMDSVDQPPQYITTETIERKYFEPHVARRLHSCDDVAAEQNSAHWKSRLATSDIVRADVAVGAATELYSWVGENRFVGAVDAIQFVDDRDSTQFLLRGASTIVGLSSLVRMILSGEDAAIFSYGDDQLQDGRLLSGFGFKVSSASSHLKFSVAGRQVTTAYDGTVLIDPKTGDLVRIVIRTGELSPAAGICEVTQSLDYARVHLNGKELLIPDRVLARLTTRNGTQLENRATYSNFRSLPPQITAAEPRTADTQLISALPGLPPGIPFSIALDQPINTATAGFGDRIQASLTSEMLDVSGKILFPAGAPVDGRIIKLLRVYGKTKSSYSLTVMIRWETVNYKRVSRRFTARVANGTRLEVGHLSGLDGILPREADGFPLRISDNGIFEIRGLKPSYALPMGMRSTWKTETP